MVRVICNEANLTGERAEISTSDLNGAISISRIDHAPEVLRNLKTNICTDYRGKTPSLYRDGIRKKTRRNIIDDDGDYFDGLSSSFTNETLMILNSGGQSILTPDKQLDRIASLTAVNSGRITSIEWLPCAIGGLSS